MQSQKRGGLASYEARRRRTTRPHRAPPRAHPARRMRAQTIVERAESAEFCTAVEAIPDLHRFLSWIKPCEHGREADERGGVVKRSQNLLDALAVPAQRDRHAQRRRRAAVQQEARRHGRQPMRALHDPGAVSYTHLTLPTKA